MALAILLAGILFGFTVARVLLAPRGVAQHVLAWSLAWPIGTGLGSVLYFLLRALGISSGLVLPVVEIVLAAVLWFFARRRRANPAIATEAVRGGTPALVMVCTALLLLTITTAGLLAVSDALPHGEWDAWSIWNLRAKFLAAPGDAWKHAASPLLSRTHPEYPLLLSGTVGSAWGAGGDQNMGVPLSASFLFFFSGIGVLFGSLWIARGLAVGAGILIAALAAPVFLSQVPAQYSDLPLATYYVGACAMGMLAVNATRTTGLLALSGLCAGLGCWTKNEGLLFTLMLGAAVLSYSTWARAWKSWLLPFAAGLAPGVLVSLAFKLMMAPSTSHALVGSDWSAKILDFGRWGRVIGALATEAWNWSPGLTHPAVIIGALLFACGWRWRQQEAPAWLAIAGAVVLTLFGYVVVLVTTPNDLEWQISTALSRLLVHLWLPALFLAGLLLDVPVVEQPQTATPAEEPPKRDAHARKRR